MKLTSQSQIYLIIAVRFIVKEALQEMFEVKLKTTVPKGLQQNLRLSITPKIFL